MPVAQCEPVSAYTGEKGRQREGGAPMRWTSRPLNRRPAVRAWSIRSGPNRPRETRHGDANHRRPRFQLAAEPEFEVMEADVIRVAGWVKARERAVERTCARVNRRATEALALRPGLP